MSNREHNLLVFFEVSISIFVAVIFLSSFDSIKILAAQRREWVEKAESEIFENAEEFEDMGGGAYKSSFGAILKQTARANSQPVFRSTSYIPVKIEHADVGAKEVIFTGAGAVAIDENTGIVLFDFKKDKGWPIASITKLLTASIILEIAKENPSLKKNIIIENADVLEGKNFVYPGEKLSWSDALTSMLSGSSNTLAKALVRETGKEREAVQDLFNKKIISWGLQKTRIKEISGLSPENISTAFETVKIFRESVKNREILYALSFSNYTISVTEQSGKAYTKKIDSTNWFLTENIETDFDFPPILKTGYIEESGYNAVGRFTKNGHSIIVAVLGVGDHYNRFVEAKKIAEWVFKNYRWDVFGTQVGG